MVLLAARLGAGRAYRRGALPRLLSARPGFSEGDGLEGLRAMAGMVSGTQPLEFLVPEGSGEVAAGGREVLDFLRQRGAYAAGGGGRKGAAGGRVVVVTGAGLSTESGIPDYRSPNGSYSRGQKPITHDEFMSEALNQKRYWARSMAGWLPFSRAMPNDGHTALAALQEAGLVSTIITQNVDALHQKAGSTDVVDLHGRNDLLQCMNCGAQSHRGSFQRALEDLNRSWLASLAGGGEWEARADGDASLASITTEDYEGFQVPHCEACGAGPIKPSVVFFGDNVPVAVKDRAFAAVDEASAMLVVGTSLSTWSAMRLVDRAAKDGKPIAIVNIGETRAETRNKVPLALRLSERAGPVLAEAARLLDAEAP